MTDPEASLLARIRFVLVRTSHPGNIGSAARAIRTMGLHRLHLVAPEAFPHAEASALAAGAGDVLDGTQVHDGLPRAIADCGLVLGATARHRGIALEELDPRARRIVEERWLKVNDDGSGGMTLHDLAAEYKVSAERIRQIEVAAMKKMKKVLAAYA